MNETTRVLVLVLSTVTGLVLLVVLPSPPARLIAALVWVIIVSAVLMRDAPTG